MAGGSGREGHHLLLGCQVLQKASHLAASGLLQEQLWVGSFFLGGSLCL